MDVAVVPELARFEVANEIVALAGQRLATAKEQEARNPDVVGQARQPGFVLPVGYHSFNKDRSINFQSNRWHSMGYWTREETKSVGAGIKDLADWKREMLALADRHSGQGRDLAAVFAYRAAEFFTHPSDIDKISLYDAFHERFYAAVHDERLETHSISYRDGVLPAPRLSPVNPRGTIVCHGELDSFMEEFYSTVDYLGCGGYEVIVFDGPGQGAAFRRSGLTMTHEWEHPVTAALDHFGLENVTLVGVSMGGYLALRASAFEERIARVVAFDIFHYDQHGSGLQGAIYRLFIRYPGLYNRVARAAMKRSMAADHVINQWMYITGLETPAERNEILQDYSVSDSAHLVRQDVLLFARAEDHMIPLKEYQKNMDGLSQARSVSGRVFTAEEQAQNHCQVGNLGLALDVILEWIGEKS